MGPFIISLLAVAAGIVLAGIARLVLPVTRRLSWSTSVLVGMLAGGLGAGLANLVGGGWPLRLTLALAVTAGALVAVEALQTRLRPPAPELRPTAELLAAGEGAQVEFKSTARRNLRTRERDERLEQVIAKTVAGFLNAEGGTLLVGVADDGTVLGLDPDYELMKSPTDDAYEQWLRDLLTTCLGTPAAAMVKIRFEDHGGRRLCRLDVPPSPAAVFLTPPKSQDRQLWVRTGNGTRQLRTDEALDYHRRRWPRR